MMYPKKYKNGLVFGKMYPPHLGHFHLIDSAIAQCEKVTVLVCSLKNEYIPGSLRYDWIRQTYSKFDVNVVHVTDEVVQYPVSDEDELFWDIWIGIIMRELSNLDVVFTSEDYGKELAKRINHKYPDLNIDSVEVDNARKKYPASGTAIRENPYKNWQYIPDIVKPYFMKKVILMGPESTGKSTMAKRLAEHFGTTYVPEYGREYTDNNTLKSVADIDYIAIGHVKRAHEIALHNAKFSPDAKFLFLDTDLIITQIWSEIYFKQVPYYAKSLQNDYIQQGDLYLLMDVDIPWHDDGTREFPYLRKWHFDRIESELKDRKLNYVIVSGDGEKRFENCLDAIKNNFPNL